MKNTSLLLFLKRISYKTLEITESFLEKRRIKKEKQKLLRKKRGVIMEWTLDFLWTVIFVFFLNQYFLQSYQIPSGSMIPNLQIGDYLFVERWTYGPTIFPGVSWKLPGLGEPERGDIITFENPDFESKGILFDTAQRLIFLMTLSFVDLDRDPKSGEPAIRLLVKRYLGEGNTYIKIDQGNFFFKPLGYSQWLNEDDYNEITGVSFERQRLIKQSDYRFYSDKLWGDILYYYGLGSSSLRQNPIALQRTPYKDIEEMDRLYSKYDSILFPNEKEDSKRFALSSDGARYIPEGFVLPIGDNRDNSIDGRFFGIVPKKALQGKTFFRFFPFSRVGEV